MTVDITYLIVQGVCAICCIVLLAADLLQLYLHETYRANSKIQGVKKWGDRTIGVMAVIAVVRCVDPWAFLGVYPWQLVLLLENLLLAPCFPLGLYIAYTYSLAAWHTVMRPPPKWLAGVNCAGGVGAFLLTLAPVPVEILWNVPQASALNNFMVAAAILLVTSIFGCQFLVSAYYLIAYVSQKAKDISERAHSQSKHVEEVLRIKRRVIGKTVIAFLGITVAYVAGLLRIRAGLHDLTSTVPVGHRALSQEAETFNSSVVTSFVMQVFIWWCFFWYCYKQTLATTLFAISSPPSRSSHMRSASRVSVTASNHIIPRREHTPRSGDRVRGVSQPAGASTESDGESGTSPSPGQFADLEIDFLPSERVAGDVDVIIIKGAEENCGSVGDGSHAHAAPPLATHAAPPLLPEDLPELPEVEPDLLPLSAELAPLSALTPRVPVLVLDATFMEGEEEDEGDEDILGASGAIVRRSPTAKERLQAEHTAATAEEHTPAAAAAAAKERTAATPKQADHTATAKEHEQPKSKQ